MSAAWKYDFLEGDLWDDGPVVKMLNRFEELMFAFVFCACLNHLKPVHESTKPELRDKQRERRSQITRKLKCFEIIVFDTIHLWCFL